MPAAASGFDRSGGHSDDRRVRLYIVNDDAARADSGPRSNTLSLHDDGTGPDVAARAEDHVAGNVGTGRQGRKIFDDYIMSNRAGSIDMHVVTHANLVRKNTAASNDHPLTKSDPTGQGRAGMNDSAKSHTHIPAAPGQAAANFRCAHATYRQDFLFTSFEPIKVAQNRLVIYDTSGRSIIRFDDPTTHVVRWLNLVERVKDIQNLTRVTSSANDHNLLHHSSP